jgi:hypothetical protein
MAKTSRSFAAIVHASAVKRLVRDRVRGLHVTVDDEQYPTRGDRVALVATHGPLFLSTAEFIATAEVRSADLGDLTLRHRVVAPKGHAVPLDALPALRVSAGWTHARLGALRTAAVRCTERDFERVEGALLHAALRFGPGPKRPAHRRPRTPGRRALIAGRAAVGRRP